MRQLHLLSPVLVGTLLLAACASTQPDPRPDPVILPAGPLEARVGTSVTFEVENLGEAVNWSVNDIEGGAAATGTVADGTYQAPARVPDEPTITVTAAAADHPERQVSARITVTAPGTLYVLDENVYVYGSLDAVDGNVAADRTFTVAGVTGEYYAMALDPSRDIAFVSVWSGSPHVYRVADISQAEGAVEGTGFDLLAHLYSAGMAYDPQRDILYVQTETALLAYHDAGSAPAATPPTRIVEGAGVGAYFDSDSRLVLDASADRLFLTNPSGVVASFESASTIDGDASPARVITVDADVAFVWGAAYDASRDELYLGDQAVAVGVHVIADASTAAGSVTPARTLGGPVNPLGFPGQIGYDVANDRLVVISTGSNTVHVFDAASTLNGDVAPSRTIGGDQVPLDYPSGGYLDPTM